MVAARVRIVVSPGEHAGRLLKNRRAEMAVLGSVLLAATGHLLIKFGLNALSSGSLPPGVVSRALACFLQPAVAVGLGIYSIGTVLWIIAVSKRDISYLFPFSALNYVIIAVGGRWLFSEAIPNIRWLGILVVFAGVWLMQHWATEKAP